MSGADGAHWQAGDAAYCTVDKKIRRRLKGQITTIRLVRGRVYRVAEVRFSERFNAVALAVPDTPGYWRHTVFRKLQPADNEFTQRLAACKPRVAEPA